MSKTRFATVATVGLALVAGQLGFASAAHAEDLGQSVDCTSVTAPADLVAAVAAANGNLGLDTINIDCADGSEILLTESLVVTDDLIIAGSGAGKTIFKRAFGSVADSSYSDPFVSEGVLYMTVDVEALIDVQDGTSLTLFGLTLDGSGANYLGRAIEVEDDSNLSISNSEIRGNNSSELCAAVDPLVPTTDDSLDPYTSECVIPYEDKSDTEPYTYAPSTSGGAFSSQTGLTSIDHSAIYNNSASKDGGAISVSGPLKMWNNTVFNNTSTSGSGGAVSISGTTDIESLILNNTFRGNSANEGSALYSEFAPVRSTGSLYVEQSCNVSKASEGLRKFNVTAGSTPNPLPSASPSTFPLDSCGTTGDAETSTNVHVSVASLNIQDDAAVNTDAPTNTGSVRTFALGEGSSAINVFTATELEELDEPALINDDARGVARKNAAAGIKVDAGAYEYVADTASVITTDGVSATSAGKANLLGKVDTNGLAPIEYGFYYSKTNPVDCSTVNLDSVDIVQVTDPAVGASVFTDSDVTPVDMSAEVTGLSSSTVYYYCAYAKTAASDGFQFGAIYQFTTLPNVLTLELNLAAGSVLDGASTEASGSGLKPGSTVELWQYSTPKLITTFTVEPDGSFRGEFTISGCETSGDHKFVVTGFAPDDTVLTDEVFFILDPNCKVQADSGTPLLDAKVTVEPVLFANRSAKLTAKYKAILRAWLPLLNEASTITISGFTETLQPSRSAIRACKKLSERRAKAVQKYLKSLGVNVKFVLKGYGATKATSKKQALNRRATITFPMIYGR